jgi:hypothetical protein
MLRIGMRMGKKYNEWRERQRLDMMAIFIYLRAINDSNLGILPQVASAGAGLGHFRLNYRNFTICILGFYGH